MLLTSLNKQGFARLVRHSFAMLAAGILLMASSAVMADANKTTAPAEKSTPVPPASQATAAAKAGEAAPSIVFGGQSLQVEDTAAKRKKTPVQVKSLFFSAQEMASIRKAVAVYVRIASGDTNGDALDFLKRLQGGGADDKGRPGARYFVYPQFFLASLVYDSPQDWSVRVNNEKLTTKEPESMGIRVIEIDKDRVKLEWMPSDMHKVEEVWNVSPNKDVKVDVKAHKVTFTLRPNQTFTSYVMRVVEGKVMPMVIDLSPKAAKGDALPGEKAAPEKPGGEKDFIDEILGARKRKP
jgi:hypothetical protein